MNDPKHPAPRHTPRTHPCVGDTYTDPDGGTATILEGPDAHGNVRVRFPDGRAYWTDGWGFWSAGTYARRDPRYDPHVGDTKTYVHEDGYECKYIVLSTQPLRYTFDGDGNHSVYGALEWPVVPYGRGWRVVYACGDVGTQGGAS